MNRIVGLTYALIASSALTTPVLAASFDCSKARQPFEKLICTNSTLSKLDDDLASSYSKARQETADDKKSILLAEQREWVKKRNMACSIDERGFQDTKIKAATEACLTLHYRNRVKELDAHAVNAAAEKVAKRISGMQAMVESNLDDLSIPSPNNQPSPKPIADAAANRQTVTLPNPTDTLKSAVPNNDMVEKWKFVIDFPLSYWLETKPGAVLNVFENKEGVFSISRDGKFVLHTKNGVDLTWYDSFSGREVKSLIDKANAEVILRSRTVTTQGNKKVDIKNFNFAILSPTAIIQSEDGRYIVISTELPEGVSGYYIWDIKDAKIVDASILPVILANHLGGPLKSLIGVEVPIFSRLMAVSFEGQDITFNTRTGGVVLRKSDVSLSVPKYEEAILHFLCLSDVSKSGDSIYGIYQHKKERSSYDSPCEYPDVVPSDIVGPVKIDIKSAFFMRDEEGAILPTNYLLNSGYALGHGMFQGALEADRKYGFAPVDILKSMNSIEVLLNLSDHSKKTSGITPFPAIPNDMSKQNTISFAERKIKTIKSLSPSGAISKISIIDQGALEEAFAGVSLLKEDIDFLSGFLHKFPNSTYQESITQKLNAAAAREIANSLATRSIDRLTYIRGMNINPSINQEAYRAIAQINFDDARKIDSVQSYDSFLSRFYDVPVIAQAQLLRKVAKDRDDRIAFEKARDSKSIQNLYAYQASYVDSAYRQEAIDLISHLTAEGNSPRLSVKLGLSMLTYADNFKETERIIASDLTEYQSVSNLSFFLNEPKREVSPGDFINDSNRTCGFRRTAETLVRLHERNIFSGSFYKKDPIYGIKIHVKDYIQIDNLINPEAEKYFNFNVRSYEGEGFSYRVGNCGVQFHRNKNTVVSALEFYVDPSSLGFIVYRGQAYRKPAFFEIRLRDIGQEVQRTNDLRAAILSLQELISDIGGSVAAARLSQAKMILSQAYESELQDAIKMDNIAAIESFINMFPRSELEVKARAEINRLVDDELARAKAANTVEALKRFMGIHSKRPQRDEADDAIYRLMQEKMGNNGFAAYLKEVPEGHNRSAAANQIVHIAIDAKDNETLMDIASGKHIGALPSASAQADDALFHLLLEQKGADGFTAYFDKLPAGRNREAAAEAIWKPIKESNDIERMIEFNEKYNITTTSKQAREEIVKITLRKDDISYVAEIGKKIRGSDEESLLLKGAVEIVRKKKSVDDLIRLKDSFYTKIEGYFSLLVYMENETGDDRIYRMLEDEKIARDITYVVRPKCVVVYKHRDSGNGFASTEQLEEYFKSSGITPWADKMLISGYVLFNPFRKPFSVELRADLVYRKAGVLDSIGVLGRADLSRNPPSEASITLSVGKNYELKPGSENADLMYEIASDIDRNIANVIERNPTFLKAALESLRGRLGTGFETELYDVYLILEKKPDCEIKSIKFAK